MNADLEDREWDVFADPDFSEDESSQEPGPDLSLLRADHAAWLKVKDTPAAWPLDEIAHRILERMRLEAVGEVPGDTVSLEALGFSALEMVHVAKIVAERAPKWIMLGRLAEDGGP